MSHMANYMYSRAAVVAVKRSISSRTTFLTNGHGSIDASWLGWSIATHDNCSAASWCSPGCHCCIQWRQGGVASRGCGTTNNKQHIRCNTLWSVSPPPAPSASPAPAAVAGLVVAAASDLITGATSKSSARRLATCPGRHLCAQDTPWMVACVLVISSRPGMEVPLMASSTLLRTNSC